MNAQLTEILCSTICTVTYAREYAYARPDPPCLEIIGTWPEAEGGNGHTYLGVKMPSGLTWEEAKVVAEELGGYLTTLTSGPENDWVYANIATEPCLWNAEAGPYIGGFQNHKSKEYREPGGGWEWVTGEPWGYENWDPAQPDNAPCGPGCPGEDFLHFWNPSAAQCPTCDTTPPCGPNNAWNDIWLSDNWMDTLIVEIPLTKPQCIFNPENGHYYELVTDEVLWVDAKMAARGRLCQGMYGHLATITSESENNFIVENVMGGVVTSAYIGGFQPEGSPEPDGGWRWVTDEPFGYTNWGSGEPNDNPGGQGENVIELKGLCSSFPYDWNDRAGYTDFFPYIVEYSPPCSGDLDGDGVVGVKDLLELLGNWGPCVP